MPPPTKKGLLAHRGHRRQGWEKTPVMDTSSDPLMMSMKLMMEGMERRMGVRFDEKIDGMDKR